MAYDESNIFAKIIDGDIPCNKIYEDEYNIAFNDINPVKPVHVLLLPKGKYTSMNEFSQNASDAEMVALNKAIFEIAKKTGIAESGYRVITNCGKNSGQEVPHLHLHILGGGDIGPLVTK
jgi:diadenosine tetraphosphate (Ap4A) HIT family hydrolase